MKRKSTAGGHERGNAMRNFKDDCEYLEWLDTATDAEIQADTEDVLSTIEIETECKREVH